MATAVQLQITLDASGAVQGIKQVGDAATGLGAKHPHRGGMNRVLIVLHQSAKTS